MVRKLGKFVRCLGSFEKFLKFTRNFEENFEKNEVNSDEIGSLKKKMENYEIQKVTSNFCREIWAKFEIDFGEIVWNFGLDFKRILRE